MLKYDGDKQMPFVMLVISLNDCEAPRKRALSLFYLTVITNIQMLHILKSIL